MTPTEAISSGTRCWDRPWGRAKKTRSRPSSSATSVAEYDEIGVGGGQRRGVTGHRVAPVLAGGGHRHLEVGVGGAQPEQLHAGVPRRTDHADLHAFPLMVRSPYGSGLAAAGLG